MKEGRQKPVAYFIQGFFFDAVTGEIIDYHGTIQYYERGATYFGEIEDIIGKSKIYGFNISPDHVTFRKQYRNRDSFIHYQFHKKGDWWEGRYTCEDGTTGESRCLIMEVPSEFFQLQKRSCI